MGHFRRWGAVYILVVLFAGSWAGHLVAQLPDALVHGDDDPLVELRRLAAEAGESR